MSVLSLSMMRSKTALFAISVTAADGTTPDNLTGDVVYFIARLKGTYRGSDYDVRIQKSSNNNGITITDPPDGMATLEIAPADTADIPDLFPIGLASGICTLTLRNGDQIVPLNSGTLTVVPNAGDETEVTMAPTTLNITGDGSTHQLAASGTALWIQFSTPSTNSTDQARVGGSATTQTNGQPLAAGDAFMYPPLKTDVYELSTVYYWLANGDELDVTIYG